MLDGSFALNGQMIVSDRFKQCFEQSGLTDLFFTPTDGSEAASPEPGAIQVPAR
ncbi:MAG TPA: hypothetical protein VFE34_21325 [Dongiaceae bacterium]|jgi:hypothetical protein|nr:hypothetical protein [Dongiaceae bacterium]